MGRTFTHDDEILRLRREGLKRTEIADKVGVCLLTVSNCMKRHGLTSIRQRKKLDAIRSKKPQKKHAFSIRLIKISEVFSVLPTSREQYYHLLEVLQAEGGVIIN